MNPATTETAPELPTGEALERRLEELMHQDVFSPPSGFLAGERADVSALRAQAELDPDGFWAEQAKEQ